MAYVYKPQGRTTYLCRYKDAATGKWKTKAGYADKSASKQLAARLERESAQRREGILPPEHSTSPIAEHVAAFLAHLRAKEVSSDHVETRERHIGAVAAACNWSTLSDLNGSQLELWLAARRQNDVKARAEGKTLKRARFSARTSNHYLQSLKHFARWCCRCRPPRLTEDPFAHVAGVNAEVDRRHERRALEPGEFADLVVAARTGGSYLGFTGPTRAVLYLTAAYTGLRASELASLTPASFNFDAKPPVWFIAAASEKARRGDSLPLHADLIQELKRYVRKVKPGEPLWPGTWAEICAAAKMLRRDLAAAGIPYKTTAGVFDFHALRVQFITGLARAGVPLQAAQRLARHCDPRLTASVYTRLGRADLAGELGKLTA